MIDALSHVIKQWIARALALCVVGPVCASIASSVVASDGSHNATFMTGHSSGFVPMLMILGFVLLYGAIIARLIDRREAFLNMAFALGWVVWTGGRMGGVFRLAPESGTLISLAIESALIAVVMLVGLSLISGLDKKSNEVTRFDLGFIKQSLSSAAGGLALGGAIIAGLLVALILGQSDLPGMSAGVGFLAGIAGGLVGTLAATSAKKDTKHPTPTPYAPLMIGIMLCGVLAPLLGTIKPGAGDLFNLVLRNDLPGYLIVSPIAWTMGALLGVPVGHAWVEHSAANAPGVAPQPS